jgi:hypothetical protein
VRQIQVQRQKRSRTAGVIRPYPRSVSEQSAQAMADAEATERAIAARNSETADGVAG